MRREKRSDKREERNRGRKMVGKIKGNYEHCIFYAPGQYYELQLHIHKYYVLCCNISYQRGIELSNEYIEYPEKPNREGECWFV